MHLFVESSARTAQWTGHTFLASSRAERSRAADSVPQNIFVTYVGGKVGWVRSTRPASVFGKDGRDFVSTRIPRA
jgi:hypothetical protein